MTARPSRQRWAVQELRESGWMTVAHPQSYHEAIRSASASEVRSRIVLGGTCYYDNVEGKLVPMCPRCRGQWADAPGPCACGYVRTAEAGA